MIILLRKKSVKWLLALLAAILLFSAVSRGFGGQEKVDLEPTAAVMATAVDEMLPEAQLTEANSAEAKMPELAPVQPGETEEPQVPHADPLAVVGAEGEDDSPKEEAGVPDEDQATQQVIALRMERSQNRAQQKAQLEDIVANSEVSAETKIRAEERLLKLSETSAMELETETLLKTKGYEQSVVMIDDKRATVYITAQLEAEDYDKIGDLVQSSTNFSLEQIIIIPK